VIDITYEEEYRGEYSNVKSRIFNNKFRLKFIEDLVQNLDSSVLILVSLVHKEGEVLKNYLLSKIKNKKIIFLYGKDTKETREHWRQELNCKDDICLIATYPIFQLGINVPSLKYLIFASPHKSRIRVLQSIGRTQRLHESKESTGAHIFDLDEQTQYFQKQGEIRHKYYEKEGFNIRSFKIEEGKNYDKILTNLLMEI